MLGALYAVLPATELLSQPAKEGTKLTTDRAQFSALFAGDSHSAGIFVEVELRTPAAQGEGGVHDLHSYKRKDFS